MAYELIETIEVGSGGASSIEFTSIPQDGVDLLLSMSDRGGSRQLRVRFNDDASANYTTIYLVGDASSVTSSSTTTSYAFLGNGINRDVDTANTFSNGSIYLTNYTSSTDKSIVLDTVTENNGTPAYQNVATTHYTTSSAITKIQILLTHYEFATFSLYKIY